MKNFVLTVATLLVSLNIWSADKVKKPKLISDQTAVLQLCVTNKEGRIARGCVDRLQVGGKVYLFDLDDSASARVENGLNGLIGTLRFHKLKTSPALDVVGYVSREKGHFPNPTVEFEVFHIVDIKNIGTISLPK